MNYSVFYEIVRYGVPFSAGVYRASGEFAQVFPTRRTFRDKNAWVRAWHIFGDEEILSYLVPIGATQPQKSSALLSASYTN